MWIASCTKLVTTVAALQCVERGLFALDSSADVDRLLPEWRDSQILTGFQEGKPILQDAKEKITLRMLLTHTSGLAYDFHPALFAWRQSRGEGPQAMRGPIAESFTHPLIFEPGMGFAYGPGLDLAGLMVARVNNCTLEQYMRRHLFDVLGMHDTSFRPLEHNNMAARLMPLVTRTSPDQSLSDNIDPSSPFKVLPLGPTDEFGGAGLFSTAEDYLELLKSLLHDDGKLLSPDMVNLMFTESISASSRNSLHELLSVPASAAHLIPGEHVVGSEGSGEWSIGLGGLLGLTDKAGVLKSPWLQGGGAPNLKWWIDRRGGTCGVFATQLSPPGEAKHQILTHRFQAEMAAILGNVE